MSSEASQSRPIVLPIAIKIQKANGMSIIFENE